MPLLGIPRLAGYLKTRAVMVRVLDLNSEFYRYILTSGYLQDRREHITSELSKLDSAYELTGREQSRYLRLAEGALIANEVIPSIDSAVKVITSPPMPTMDYFAAMDSIHKALRMVSASYGDYQLTFDSLYSVFNWQCPTDVMRAARQTTHNPFRDAFVNLNIPARIARLTPELVGISVTFESQLIPALILSFMLREQGASARIVLGGGLFQAFAQLITLDSPFFELIDGVIVGPGELALEDAYHGTWEHLAASGGKVIRRESRKFIVDSRGVKGPTPSASLPDFSDLAFHQYLSPQPVLPFQLRDKCYWGRCSFCASNTHAASPGRLSITAAVNQLQRLQELYAIDMFYILDSALSPDDLIDFSETLLRRGVHIQWAVNARFEAELADRETCNLLHNAGCRMLKFGLESASPRVLERMRKGIDLEVVQAVIRACKNAGITTHVYLIFGFPGEDDKDREMTVSFVREMADQIDMYSSSEFMLYEGTPISRQPETFGIEIDHLPSTSSWCYPKFKEIKPRENHHPNLDDLRMRLREFYWMGKNRYRALRSTAHTLACADVTMSGGFLTKFDQAPNNGPLCGNCVVALDASKCVKLKYDVIRMKMNMRHEQSSASSLVSGSSVITSETRMDRLHHLPVCRSVGQAYLVCDVVRNRCLMVPSVVSPLLDKLLRGPIQLNGLAEQLPDFSLPDLVLWVTALERAAVVRVLGCSKHQPGLTSCTDLEGLLKPLVDEPGENLDGWYRNPDEG